MGLVSSTIPNLINGVSQQPYVLRLSSQCDLLENGYATVAEGLKKRPPSNHVAKLFNEPVDDAFIHVINRDEKEQYIVTITKNDIKIHDVEGNPYQVSFPDGLGYLQTEEAATSFRAVTIADFTFIVNNKIKVEKGTKKSGLRPYEALVSIKQGNYGKTYRLLVNGNAISSFTTPNGTSAADAPFIDTTYIATQLVNGVSQPPRQTIAVSVGNLYHNIVGYNSTYDPNTGTYTNDPIYNYSEFTLTSAYDIVSLQILANGNVITHTPVAGQQNRFRISYANTSVPPSITARYFFQPANPTGLQVVRFGTTLHISSPDDFAIAVEDGFNGNAMLAIKGRAQKFSDLPNQAPNDFTIEVVGDPSSNFDNYYVRFDKNNLSDAVGVWRETVKPGVDVEIAPGTMPHVLVREADGTFTFRRAEWGERIVGDEDSSPYPSFVGNKIADLFFYRNRLGLLSEENVIFSEASEFFNFFPTTVTTVLDSDPIDVAVSHVKVSLLRHAVPFNQELMLFSAQTQFTVASGDLLTPKSVSIDQTTEFECSVKTRPVGAGRNVFFCVNKGSYTGVREYYVDGDTKTNDAADVTGHVPKYIPGNVLKMAAATNEDMLVLLSGDDRRSLYVYRYYWSGEEKLQSSWSRWVFGTEDRLLSLEFIETKLFIVVARPDGTYLEVINTELGATDGDILPYRIMLDRKVTVTGGALVKDGGITYTTVEVPYTLTNDQFLSVGVEGAGTGEIVPVEKKDGALVVQGDYQGQKLVIGRTYNFRYRFSTQTVKQLATGGGSESVTQGRLQLRRFSVTYENSGAFRAIVTPRGREPYTYQFTGRILGDRDNRLGETALATGIFRFPVMAKNTDVDIEIENDSPLPVTLLSAAWEGFFVIHTQRL